MKWGSFCLFLLSGFLPLNKSYPEAHVLSDYYDFRQYCIETKHPLHISFTNIEFNQSENRFEILFKLFVDDFDLIIRNKYNKNLYLVEGKKVKGYSDIIDKYLLEHFKLVINGNDKTKSLLKFDKSEVREQSIWLYYNFSFKGNCSIFDIQNSLMTDLYQDQTNLLIFTFKNEQKAIKFNRTKTNEKLTF